MKRLTQTLLLFGILLCVCASCSKDKDLAPNKLNHVGEKWRIATVEYNIVDPGISNPLAWVKNGTATNAGAFYFDGKEGSFDIVIDSKRQEDYFGYMNDDGNITIINVEQSFSITRFSQSVISFSGSRQTIL